RHRLQGGHRRRDDRRAQLARGLLRPARRHRQAVVGRAVVVDREVVGCGAVALAVELLQQREPELGERFRMDKTGRSAQTGGSVQWCIAYQLGLVTNPADTTETVSP